MNKKLDIPLVDRQLSIDCPIGRVFTFLSNHENYIQWFPGVIAIQSADNLPHATIGKIYNEILRLPTGRHQSMAIKVVESHAPDLFITESNFAPIHPRMEVRLSRKSAEETVLNLRFFSRSQSAVGRFLIRTFVKKAFTRQSETGLRRLKNILEAQILQK